MTLLSNIVFTFSILLFTTNAWSKNNLKISKIDLPYSTIEVIEHSPAKDGVIYTPFDYVFTINPSDLIKKLIPTQIKIFGTPLGRGSNFTEEEMTDDEKNGINGQIIIAKDIKFETTQDGKKTFKVRVEDCGEIGQMTDLSYSVTFSNKKQTFGGLSLFQCKSSTFKKLELISPKQNDVWLENQEINLIWKGGDTRYGTEIDLSCSGCKSKIIAELNSKINNYSFKVTPLKLLINELEPNDLNKNKHNPIFTISIIQRYSQFEIEGIKFNFQVKPKL